MIRKTLLLTIFTVILAHGCSDEPPEEEEDVWASSVQEGIPSGVALSAWSNGDELLFAGGTLSTFPGQETGTEGVLLRLNNGTLCKQTIADRPIWWIDGNTPGEFYAVGERGLILHVKDDVITNESIPTENTLYGIWVGSGDPIAVGGDPFTTNKGEVWRRENGTWTLFASDLSGVAFKVWEDWIVGTGVAWQIEDGQLIERSPPSLERLVTVRGRSSDDVWAVGGLSLPSLLHWNGTAWESIDIDPFCAVSGLTGVWTAPGEDVWVTGYYGGVGRYNSDTKTWLCPETNLTEEHFHAVWKHQGDIWFVGGNLLMPGASELLLSRYGEESLAYDVQECQ